MNRIHYYWSERNEKRITEARDPAWPIQSPEELEEIRRVASQMGVEMIEATSTEACGCQVEPRRLVVGYKLDDPGPAELYAHFTGRQCVLLDDLSALRVLDGIDVLVSLSGDFTLEVIEALYDERPSSPGVLFAGTIRALYRVIKKQAVAARSLSSLNTRMLVGSALDSPGVLGALDFSCVSERHDQHSWQHITEVLAYGYDILSIIAHSDGVDARLPQGVLLCSYSNSAARPGDYVPLCKEIGRCTRYPDLPPVDEALAVRALLPTTKICAKLLLLAMCGGIRVEDGTLDSRYNLATSIIENATFGAIVASWQSMDSSLDWIAYLVSALEKGECLGNVVSRLNISRDGVLTRYGLCIVGDPLLCFQYSSPTPRVEAIKPSETKLLTEATFAGGKEEEVAYLTAVVQTGMEQNLYCDEDAALTLLDMLADLNSNGGVARTQQSTAFTKTALDFFGSFCVLEESWVGLNHQNHFLSRDFRCQVCDGHAQLLQTRFDEFPEMARYTVSCPRCSVVVDSPVNYFPMFERTSIGTPLLRLRGIPEGATARVDIISRHFPFSCSYNWPTDLAGRMSEGFEFPPPTGMPKGPLLCRVLIAWNLKVAALGFRMRANAYGWTGSWNSEQLKQFACAPPSSIAFEDDISIGKP